MADTAFTLSAIFENPLTKASELRLVRMVKIVLIYSLRLLL